MSSFLGNFSRKLLISSHHPFQFARRFLYCVLVVTAFGQLAKLFIFAGTPEAVFRSDLTQDYVVGRALLTGLDCRIPVDSLVKTLLASDSVPALPHASPHSPLINLIFLPLSLLEPKVAHQLWVLISALCGFAAFYILGDLVQLTRKGTVALLWLCLAIFSVPGVGDLLHGQWNFQQMLILSLFLRAHFRGQFIKSAAYLAFVVALRPIVIPLCIYSLITSNKRFRSAFIVSLGAITLALLFTLGSTVILSFPAAARSALSVWEGFWANLSTGSLAANLFLPMNAVANEVYPLPVLPRPITTLYKIVGGALSVGLCLVSVLRAHNREPLQAMMSMLVISPLIAVIAWPHYLVLLFIPLFVDGARLLNHSGLRGRLAVVALIIPMVYPAVTILGLVASKNSFAPAVPVAISLQGRLVYSVLTLLPILAWGLYPLTKAGSYRSKSAH